MHSQRRQKAHTTLKGRIQIVGDTIDGNGFPVSIKISIKFSATLLTDRRPIANGNIRHQFDGLAREIRSGFPVGSVDPIAEHTKLDIIGNVINALDGLCAVVVGTFFGRNQSIPIG